MPLGAPLYHNTLLVLLLLLLCVVCAARTWDVRVDYERDTIVVLSRMARYKAYVRDVHPHANVVRLLCAHVRVDCETGTIVVLVLSRMCTQLTFESGISGFIQFAKNFVFATSQTRGHEFSSSFSTPNDLQNLGGAGGTSCKSSIPICNAYVQCVKLKK